MLLERCIWFCTDQQAAQRHRIVAALPDKRQPALLEKGEALLSASILVAFSRPSTTKRSLPDGRRRSRGA
jgi:hypothetical protein